MDEVEQAHRELERIEAIITRHEGFIFTVRGWLLVIVGGLIAGYYASNVEMSEFEVRIALLAIALLFLIVESRHLNLVEALVKRAGTVERSIAAARGDGWYDGPKVSETCQRGARRVWPKSGMTFLLNLPFYLVVILVVVITTVSLPRKSGAAPQAAVPQAAPPQAAQSVPS